VIFVIMHVTWGAGFVSGSIRFGPPVEALLRATGVRGAPPSGSAPPGGSA
jgi:hypothetical protein